MPYKPEPICIYCHKRPEDLAEYIVAGKQENRSPLDFVRYYEGTYSPTYNLFCCTKCYLLHHAPSSTELRQAYHQYRTQHLLLIHDLIDFRQQMKREGML